MLNIIVTECNCLNFDFSYAITVWYFDKSEKLSAITKKQKQDTMDGKVENKQHLHQPILQNNEQKLHESQLSFPNKVSSDT